MPSRSGPREGPCDGGHRSVRVANDDALDAHTVYAHRKDAEIRSLDRWQRVENVPTVGFIFPSRVQ